MNGIRPKKTLLTAGLLSLAVLPAAGTASAQNPNSQDLSLEARPNPAVAGQSVVLSGRLKGKDKENQTVVLQGAPFPFTPFNTNVATTRTNSGGNYSFTRRPQLNTLYRTRVGNLNSPNVTVQVRRRVSLFVSDSTPRRGQIVRFSGRACPQGDGRIVSIQKRTSTGSFRTVRRTRLREASRCSVYSKRLRIFTDGVFRAVVAADASHLRGFSRTRGLDAHR